MFVATQRYIPLSETRASVIFIEPEGRNVCLKERNHIVDYRTQEFKYRPKHCKITTLQAGFETVFPAIISFYTP